MKRGTFILFCFFLSSLVSIAQTCKLSGKVNDPDTREIHLFLLEGGTYFTSPSAKLKVSANGSFSQKITVGAPIFAILKAGNKQQRLLLSAGRDVEIYIDSSAGKPNIIKGKGMSENQVVISSVLSKPPFFMQREWTAENLTAANWEETILQPVQLDIQTTTRQIQKARVPRDIQEILMSELRYAYQCYLNDLAAGKLYRSKHPDQKALLDLVMQWQPLPDSQALVSGFYANMMLERHAKYAANSVARTSDPKKAEQELADYLKMPFDSIVSVARIHGEAAVLGWLYARHYMPASIRDKILYNYLKEAAANGSLSTSSYLFGILKENFPQSTYTAKAQTTMQQLQQTLRNNAANRNIIFNDASNIQSLNQLVEPYKGKIVYLDIWGTWCGPCKEEMPYAAELKKKYAGKDIVFVYLDMDDPSKEDVWKQVVYHAALEGEHYRMDKASIENIWQAVREAGGETGLYPTYIIIGRDGKIINPGAERPSSREKLYAQLDKVLTF